MLDRYSLDELPVRGELRGQQLCAVPEPNRLGVDGKIVWCELYR
ncbi:hypothetical protein [Streptomyces sp. Ac-502]